MNIRSASDKTPQSCEPAYSCLNAYIILWIWSSVLTQSECFLEFVYRRSYF